jgi:serine/threonine-protein kinase
VSPQNVIVGADGTARVLDFGVAKAVGRIQSTREGEIKGKLAYMAPEQMKGAAMDRRTDIYGAAVVLWEALTARRLFDGEHAGVVFTRVMAGDVTPPTRLVPGLPPVLDEIVFRGLALDPNMRYPTARAMAMDLEDRVGIASPRQVGEWLAEVAGDALSKRAFRVKEIESVSTPPPMQISAVVPGMGSPSSSGMPMVPGMGPPSSSGMPAPRSSNPSFTDSALRSRGSASGGHAPPSAPDLSFGPLPSDSSVSTGASSRLQASSITVSPGSSGAASPGPRSRWTAVAAGVLAVAVGASVAVGVFRGGDRDPEVSAVQGEAPASTSSAVAPGVNPEPSAAADAPPAPSTSAVAAAPSASARPVVTAKPGGPAKAPKGGDCSVPFTIDAKGIRRVKPQCL